MSNLSQAISSTRARVQSTRVNEYVYGRFGEIDTYVSSPDLLDPKAFYRVCEIRPVYQGNIILGVHTR